MARQSGTLTFRNREQAILWNCELVGQISDGQWENASPTDHWEAWAGATVAIDPENVGRDFDVKRDSYGFTRKSFLDEGFDLAGRAMGYVRVGRAFPELDVESIRTITDYAGTVLYPIGDTYAAAREAIARIGKARIAAAIVASSLYGRDELLADLRDISAIIKVDKMVDPNALVEGNHRNRFTPNIHAASCASVRNQTYKSYRTVSDVVRDIGIGIGTRLHTCIPDERRASLTLRAREIRDAGKQMEHRRNLLVAYAVSIVAMQRLTLQVGETTPDETKLVDEYIEQLKDGRFRPHSVRDLRDIAIKRDAA